MVSRRVMLDVPGELVAYVSRLLAAHRREIGTPKGARKLGCCEQALFVLAWSRTREISGGWTPGSGCGSPRRTGAERGDRRPGGPGPRT